MSPLTPARFVADYWQRKPLVTHGQPARLADLFGKRALPQIEDLLAMTSESRVMFETDAGQSHSIPQSPREARLFFRGGMTLYFQLADERLQAWSERIGRELDLRAKHRHVSIFASPAKHGTAVHFDANENFTLQLTGTKDWWVGTAPGLEAPTMNWFPDRPLHPELAAYCASPPAKFARRHLKRIRMRPGSMLYVPRGCWHSTYAPSESISLNLSFTPTLWLDVVAEAIQKSLVKDPAWRGIATHAANDRARAHLGTLVRGVHVQELVADLFPSGKLRARSRLRRNRLTSWTIESKSAIEDATLEFRHEGMEATSGRLEVERALIAPIRWMARLDAVFTVAELRDKFPALSVARVRELVACLIEARFLTVIHSS